MEKILKDNLKDFIQVGTTKCYSICEALKLDYNRFKTTGEGFGIATYRGKGMLLDIDIESRKIPKNMNVDNYIEKCVISESLYGNIYKQIEHINELLDEEV
jgi:hypothetical protein